MCTRVKRVCVCVWQHFFDCWAWCAPSCHVTAAVLCKVHSGARPIRCGMPHRLRLAWNNDNGITYHYGRAARHTWWHVLKQRQWLLERVEQSRDVPIGRRCIALRHRHAAQVFFMFASSLLQQCCDLQLHVDAIVSVVGCRVPHVQPLVGCAQFTFSCCI